MKVAALELRPHQQDVGVRGGGRSSRGGDVGVVNITSLTVYQQQHQQHMHPNPASTPYNTNLNMFTIAYTLKGATPSHPTSLQIRTYKNPISSSSSSSSSQAAITGNSNNNNTNPFGSTNPFDDDDDEDDDNAQRDRAFSKSSQGSHGELVDSLEPLPPNAR